MTLTFADLVIGGVYRGKRPKRTSFFDPNEMDDRVIIYMSPLDTGEHRNIQYDSYAVPNGRHYPTTTAGKFLRWAKCRVNEDGTPYAASAIEARQGGNGVAGAVEDESAVAKPDAQGSKP